MIITVIIKIYKTFNRLNQPRYSCQINYKKTLQRVYLTYIDASILLKSIKTFISL